MANFPFSPLDPVLIFQISYTTLPAFHASCLIGPERPQISKQNPFRRKEKGKKQTNKHLNGN